MFPPVYQVLTAAPSVVAIAGSRVGAHGEIEQTSGRPYVTWQIVSGVPENGLDDLPDVDSIQVQLNIVAATDADVRALAIAVRDAVEPHAHIVGIPIDERDPETRLYRVALEAAWWVPR